VRCVNPEGRTDRDHASRIWLPGVGSYAVHALQ
jgi:hypothetical protein